MAAILSNVSVPGPPRAMVHAGHHVQLQRLPDRVLAHRMSDVGEVVDAVQRRDLRIGPAVIHQQLAAAVEERLQIRVARMEHAVVLLQRQLDVGRGLNRCQSQFGSLKTTYLNASSAVPIGSRPGRASASPAPSPAQSAGKITAPVFGFFTGAYSAFARLDLRRRQTRRAVRALAREHFRIEPAARRVLDHAVLDAVAARRTPASTASWIAGYSRGGM